MKNTENENRKYYLEYILTNFQEEITQEYDDIDIDMKEIELRAKASQEPVRWLAAFCVLQRLRRWKLRIGA